MTISCSQQKATKAEFSFTIGAISTSSFPGGLMIYGQNATKTAVFGQRHFSGPMALDLSKTATGSSSPSAGLAPHP